MILKISLSLSLICAVLTVTATAQDLVGSVRSSLDRGSFAEVIAKLQQYRQARGTTPEYLEAYSWLARDTFSRGDYPSAINYADQTYKFCLEQLKSRQLDAEPRLPTALGAAIEVRGQALAKSHQGVKARQYLVAELGKYRNTSIAPRIQKNINLLGMQGKLAPALALEPHLGPKPSSLATLKGKPVILFLWAHWCSDCKAQAPILARLKQEFEDKFHLVGPTQLYGYGASGVDASPAQEIEYIDFVRKKYFGILSEMPVPVSGANFQRYGVSTTPTIVLLSTSGRVALYHPGRMTYEDLRAQLVPLITNNK